MTATGKILVAQVINRSFSYL